MSNVGIPDEAYTAARAQGVKFPLAWESIVQAAAPHIARAAQVQILREIADEWVADEIGASGDTVERETWWIAIGALQGKADELDAAQGAETEESK